MWSIIACLPQIIMIIKLIQENRIRFESLIEYGIRAIIAYYVIIGLCQILFVHFFDQSDLFELIIGTSIEEIVKIIFIMLGNRHNTKIGVLIYCFIFSIIENISISFISSMEMEQGTAL